MVESRNRGYTGRNYTKVAIGGGGETFYREYPGRIVQKDSFSIRFPPVCMYSPDPGRILDPEKGLHEKEDRPDRLDLFAPLHTPSSPPSNSNNGRKRAARPRDRALNIAIPLPPPRGKVYMYIYRSRKWKEIDIHHSVNLRDKEEARLDEVSMEHGPPLRKIQLDGSKNKFFPPFHYAVYPSAPFSTPPSRGICFLGPRPMILRELQPRVLSFLSPDPDRTDDRNNR